MNHRLTNGFIAGAIGAIILVAIMYIMQAMDMDKPGFVTMYQGTFGDNRPSDQIIAAILFIISGGIWGVIFALIVKDPTIVKGMLFGFLPTLWLWVAVNGFMGKPLFNGFSAKGIIMPIIFNVVIWGTFVGWYMANKINKSYKTEKVI